MIYYLPKYKKDHLKKELNSILSRALESSSIPARELAKVIGKVVSCLRALGPIIKIFLRSSQYALDKQVLLEGWDSEVELHHTIAGDIKFILDNIDEENGQPIFTSKMGSAPNCLVTGNFINQHSN